MTATHDSYEYIGTITSAECTERGVLLKSDDAVIAASFFAPGVVRVRAARGADLRPDHSWVVAAEPEPVAFDFEKVETQ